MAKGGYQIIDFKGTNFIADTPVTIEGVYERIEGSYLKAVLLENFTVDGGAAERAVWASVEANAGNYVVRGYNWQSRFTISSDDSITWSTTSAANNELKGD